MRFGFVVPYASARQFAELSALGEGRGWDAVFTWEAVWGESAWVTLGAAAMTTTRIRLGTLLTTRRPAGGRGTWCRPSAPSNRLSGWPGGDERGAGRAA